MKPCFLRDFFASFLFLSLEEKIDAIEVLSSPLTPVLLSLLTYSDGSTLSSQKSNVMQYLETFEVSETPEVFHKTNIDVMFSSFASSCEFTKHV